MNNHRTAVAKSPQQSSRTLSPSATAQRLLKTYLTIPTTAVVLEGLDVAERELYKAAFHEAGHVVCTWALGGISTAEVWRNPNRDPYLKAWRGRATIISPPTRRPATWRPIVGVAGTVAECLLQNENALNGVYDRWDEISETDREMMGETKPREVEAASSLLSKYWPAVCALAAELVMVARYE